MDRFRFLNYKGKLILFLDLSELAPEASIQVLTEGKRLIATQPKNSLLILTDVHNARYNLAIAETIKEFVNHNKPYVRASAVIGLAGLQKVVLQTAEKFSGRNLSVFEDAEKAKEWLISQ